MIGELTVGQDVPDGMVFVTGDNAEVSFDSRHFGCVPCAQIAGRVEASVVAIDATNHYLPRGERWFCPVH